MVVSGSLPTVCRDAGFGRGVRDWKEKSKIKMQKDPLRVNDTLNKGAGGAKHKDDPRNELRW